MSGSKAMGDHRARRADRRRSGMTLIELMITITLLVVVWGGAMSSQMAASDLVMTGRETSIASVDLQSCMERILSAAHADIPLAGSEFEDGQPVQLYEELHLANQRVVATYPGYVAGQPVPDPLTIVLTVTWNDFEGRPRTMQLSTIKGE
jgi:prepilin-type N-terminal cleavage/methylation domain-containing protein